MERATFDAKPLGLYWVTSIHNEEDGRIRLEGDVTLHGSYLLPAGISPYEHISVFLPDRGAAEHLSNRLQTTLFEETEKLANPEFIGPRSLREKYKTKDINDPKNTPKAIEASLRRALRFPDLEIKSPPELQVLYEAVRPAPIPAPVHEKQDVAETYEIPASMPRVTPKKTGQIIPSDLSWKTTIREIPPDRTHPAPRFRMDVRLQQASQHNVPRGTSIFESFTITATTQEAANTFISSLASHLEQTKTRMLEEGHDTPAYTRTSVFEALSGTLRDTGVEQFSYRGKNIYDIGDNHDLAILSANAQRLAFHVERDHLQRHQAYLHDLFFQKKKTTEAVRRLTPLTEADHAAAEALLATLTSEERAALLKPAKGRTSEEQAIADTAHERLSAQEKETLRSITAPPYSERQLAELRAMYIHNQELLYGCHPDEIAELYNEIDHSWVPEGSGSMGFTAKTRTGMGHKSSKGGKDAH